MAGLKAARARGRKVVDLRLINKKLNQANAMYHSKRMTVKEIQETTEVSAATLFRSLKEEPSSKGLLFLFHYSARLRKIKDC
jgi:predicted phage gp36 major capsid-like protein